MVNHFSFFLLLCLVIPGVARLARLAGGDSLLCLRPWPATSVVKPKMETAMELLAGFKEELLDSPTNMILALIAGYLLYKLLKPPASPPP